MKRGEVSPAEARRLARIRELAREDRKTRRALERAIRAAHERGISVRRIAAAAGWAPMAVWRLARPGSGQPGLAAADVRLPNRVAKPKTSGKKAASS